MLTRVHIKRFRSCRDIHLNDLRDTTTLVGRNGAGKTNILKAIAWAANKISQADYSRSGATASDSTADVRMVFRLDDVEYQFRAEARVDKNSDSGFAESEALHRKDRNGRWVKLLSTGPSGIHVRGLRQIIGSRNPPLLLAADIMAPTEMRDELLMALEFVSHIRYYTLDEPRDPTADPRGLGVVRRKDYVEYLSNPDHSPPNSVIMRLIDLSLEHTETFEEIKSLMGEYGLNLVNDIRVTAYPVSSDSPYDEADEDETLFSLEFQILSANNEPYVARWRDLSHGTRRVLRLITSILYDESSVFLIEHPEDGIHHGLLHKLLEVVRSYTEIAQFFFTTHSHEAISYFHPEELRLVTLADGVTNCRPLTRNELNAAGRYMQNDGPLSEFIESIQE